MAKVAKRPQQRRPGARAEASVRSTRRSRARLWGLVAFLAGVFAIKLVVVLQLKDHLLLQPDTTMDTGVYFGLARQVLAGDLALGPGLYYVDPLYIYFLALGYGLTHSLAAVRILQALLGTVSVGLIFLTAREWFGERAAWAAASLAALTGLFSFYEAVILQASLDAFLTSAALFVLTLALTRGTLRWYVLSGLAFGVQSLNRPNVLMAAVVLVGLLLLTRRSKPSVWLAAGLVLGLAPVGLRNAVVSHQWSPVSSHGGLNFYIGNQAGATGFYRPVPGVRPTIEGQEFDTRRVAEQALGRSLTDAEVSNYYFGLAFAWMREHPAAWARLLARKIFYVFNAQHTALPLSYPFYAYDARTILRVLAVGPWLLIPLGLFGLVAAAPAARRGEYFLWLSFVPAYALSVALFFVSERYRVPLLVSFAIGAGAGLDYVLRRLAARQYQALVVGAVVLVPLFVAANWRLNFGDADGRDEERIRMAENLARQGRVEEAEHWAALGLEGYPYPQLAHYRVGTQFVNSGQWAPAIAHLSVSEQLDPGAPLVEYALGRALLGAGRVRDAIPHLQRAVDGKVDVDLAGFDLAQALEQTGDLAGAARVVRGLVPAAGDDVEVWLRLGRFAAEVKAPDAAEPFFRHAVEMSPNQASARQQYGLNLLVLGRFDDAVRELSVAARLNPQDATSFSSLAYCELKLGRVSDARAHVETALRLNPADDMAKQLAAALARIR